MNIRQWKRSPSRKQRRMRKIWFILAIVFIFFIQFFVYVEKNLKPPLMKLAKIRITQLATQAINSAISSQIAEGVNVEKLIDWKLDNNGKVSGFLLNYSEHMKIASDTKEQVQNLLLSMKSMPEHIPLGQALNSSIIASYGPKIPIRLVPLGAVQVDLNTRYWNAGINMILVEVFMRITAEVVVVIPLDSGPEIVETELPISYVLVIGDTPAYYVDNKGNPIGNSAPMPPSVSLPGATAPTPLNPQNGSSGGSSMQEDIGADAGVGGIGIGEKVPASNGGLEMAPKLK